MSDTKIFPSLRITWPDEGKAGYEKKCLYHERLLYRYLQRKMEGWSVKQFFESENIDSFALYAVTDFTHLFLKDLGPDCRRQGLKAVCDRNAGMFRKQLGNYPVASPDELAGQYHGKAVDKIIVMSVLHENEIISDLLKKGILLDDIISVVSVLYA